MKTYDERMQEVLKKIGKKRCKRFRIIRSAVAICCIAALALVLFMPYSFGPPSVAQYRGSEYYDLIQKINLATYQPPKYNSNFEKWTEQWNSSTSDGAESYDDWLINSGGLIHVMGGSQTGGVLGSDGTQAPDSTQDFIDGDTPIFSANSAGTTDNQAEAVIEGDLIKRTDHHIFYLRGPFLSAYSIAQAQTREVGKYSLNTENVKEVEEIYLSEDGTTLTLIVSCFGDVLGEGMQESVLCILNLDVSDPEKMVEAGRTYITGSYLSSRLADGKLLVMSKFGIREEHDFSNPATYLPRFGVPGNMQTVSAENIAAPEELTHTRYTVVSMMDQKTLATADTAAFLSYSEQVYVSAKNIYVTSPYIRQWDQYGCPSAETVTRIAALGYAKGKLEYKGFVEVAGTVKNQYSMNEKDGILRIVTSTAQITKQETGATAAGSVTRISRNVDLYCIDLKTWRIAAKVEAFASQGEKVEAARFDENAAYVRIAGANTLTDTVYMFDLSDLNNITWEDTSTLGGCFSSLVNFGNGYLLGIGYGENDMLKIEIYEEGEEGAVSIAAYERNYAFSEDYKSYLIDREDQLIGLGITRNDGNTDGANRYLLLRFDGYEFQELVNVPLYGSNSSKRAVLIDGWLYMFANDAIGFRVEQVW